MNVALYQSAASLQALERWQDAVAQNITSNQVSGFKRRTVQVSAQQAGGMAIDGRDSVDRPHPLTGLFPQTRYSVSFAAGENQPTRRELDFAIDGEGFFKLRDENDQLYYSRAGQFSVRADRTLITSGGHEVMGAGETPIQLVGSGPVELLPDGTIRQGGATLGKLEIVKPENPAFLLPLSSGYFVTAPGVDMVEVEEPLVLQGYLEASNIQPLREMIDLVSISRAYEANQKMIQTRDQLLERVLESLT
jgi:flagellar basal-body rod protein FlgF